MFLELEEQNEGKMKFSQWIKKNRSASRSIGARKGIFGLFQCLIGRIFNWKVKRQTSLCIFRNCSVEKILNSFAYRTQNRQITCQLALPAGLLHKTLKKYNNPAMIVLRITLIPYQTTNSLQSVCNRNIKFFVFVLQIKSRDPKPDSINFKQITRSCRFTLDYSHTQ